jgi:hypothetical protein
VRTVARAAALALALTAVSTAGRAASGTTAEEVLDVRPSARADALGGAYVALGDEVSALPYNPAAMAFIQGPSVSFLHFVEVDSVSLEDLDYGQKFDFGTLGLGVEYQGQPAIENPMATDAPVVAWDLVITGDYAFALNRISYNLPGFLSNATGGVALKFIESQLGAYTADAFAVDFGLRAPLGDGLTFGASILNLGTPVKFISVSDPLPATALVGVSRSFDPLFSNQFNFSADLDDSFLDTTRLRFGAEDWIGKILALRVGYVLDSAQSLNGMTGGFGVVLDQDGLIFHLDYAILPYYFSGFNSMELQQQFQMSLTF